MKTEKIVNIIIMVIVTFAFAVGVFVFIDSYIPTKETDRLTRLYYIGGIVSGIFAFAAFFVATLTYSHQKRTGDLQRFETTLFNMLGLQQQITNELKYNGREPIKCPEIGEKVDPQEVSKQGRELFEFLWQKKCFYDRFSTEGKIDLTNGRWYQGMCDVLISKGKEGYNQFVEVTVFDHYFRHLYRMVRFVDDADCLNEKEKYAYVSIIRATLSSFELVWLYYNSLYGVGQPKFKPLIEKYALLKNLREDFLTISKEVIDEDYFKKFKVVPSDYEAHLTCRKNVEDKFYLGAFYNERNKEEFSIGMAFYNDRVRSKFDK